MAAHLRNAPSKTVSLSIQAAMCQFSQVAGSINFDLSLKALQPARLISCEACHCLEADFSRSLPQLFQL